MEMSGLDHRRGSGVALWRQIQQILETEIGRGLYRPGERLPTEFQLADRFGVNRHTVRRALGGLEEKGLLRVEQGRGTFVHEHVIDYRLGKRTRFTENLSRQSRAAGGSLIEVVVEPADAQVAAGLSLREGTPVVRLRRAGEVDGRRINVGDHYLEAARFPGLERTYAETNSITETLHRFGIDDYTRQRTRILARMPSGADADLLRQPRNRPVLVTEGVNVDAEGRPVEFTITRWASDWVQIVVDS
jgi:GntR family phosphonate transport system transcriptional regulator